MADPKIHETYTIEELIDAGSNDTVTYSNFSLLERINDIEIPTENIIFDYLTELKAVSVNVNLTESEYLKYKYKPKLLSYDVYGTTEAYFIIMAINNIIDVRDFTMKRIKMIKSDLMNEIIGYIYNSNYNMIRANREYLREGV